MEIPLLIILCTIQFFRDTWQCLLCTDINEIVSHIVNEDDKTQSTLSSHELKLARRLVLELYCQYEPSLPFRDNAGPEV